MTAASSDESLASARRPRVIGLSDGWKPDSWTSGGVSIWQLAKATAKPASARKRASGFNLGLSTPIARTASFQVPAHDHENRGRYSEPVMRKNKTSTASV